MLSARTEESSQLISKMSFKPFCYLQDNVNMIGHDHISTYLYFWMMSGNIQNLLFNHMSKWGKYWIDDFFGSQLFGRDMRHRAEGHKCYIRIYDRSDEIIFLSLIIMLKRAARVSLISGLSWSPLRKGPIFARRSICICFHDIRYFSLRLPPRHYGSFSLRLPPRHYGLSLRLPPRHYGLSLRLPPRHYGLSLRLPPRHYGSLLFIRLGRIDYCAGAEVGRQEYGRFVYVKLVI